MVQQSSEIELVTLAQAGDRSAVGRLLLLHSEQLTRQLAARIPPSLRRTTSVEDILQNTFSVAFHEMESFQLQGPGSFYAWLRTIAEHQLLNEIKHAQRRKRGGHLTQIDTARNDSGRLRDLFDQLSAGDGTPSLDLRKDEAFTALNVALAELPDDYREVIRLRFLRGLSLQETAQRMERTPAAIRALTLRAKEQLRERVGRLSLFLSSI